MSQSYYEKNNENKTFLDRVKENPLLTFSFLGFNAIAGYRIYKIRADRKLGLKKRLSMELIYTRLYAQGFVLGTVTLSVCYMLGKRIYNTYIDKKPSIEK